MSNALAIIPRSIPEVTSLAEVLAKSTLLPEALRGKVPDVIVSILAGQELGLAPMAALRGVHVINGKPVIAADTMVGLVLSSGLCEYFIDVERTATSVTCETKRKGSPVAQKCTWTIEDAKRAGLNAKDTWRLYPRAMLASRARAELARSAYPDVLAGVYDPDELGVEVRPTIPRDDVVDAEYTETVAASPTDAIRDALVADMEAATTRAELDALLPRFAALPKGDPNRAAAHAVYKTRHEVLT